MNSNSRPKAVWKDNIFCKQRVFESGCTRKRTVGMGIFKTPCNANRKIICHNIDWTFHDNKEK